jgi:hypothetical protein
VQIGEKDLAAMQFLALRGKRLLHLYDHLRTSENFVRGRDDLGARRDVFFVRQARAQAGVSLDQDLVAVVDQLGDRIGGETHPEFVVLDLFGNTDPHRNLL